MNDDLKKQIIEYSIKLNTTNLSPLRSGNLSIRAKIEDEEGFYITPSGVKYENLKISDIVFLSLNKEYDNLTIVKKILDIMGKSEDLIEFVEDRPGHDFRYSMSSEKIMNELNWKVETDFDKGLENTIEWYLNEPDILNNISQTVLEQTPWKNN